MEVVDLARWSDWLLLELFEDVDGEARPVTTLVVDDDLLVRAAARGGHEVAPEQARAGFLSAFPPRWRLVRWCSGRDSPFRELLAFLVLWCFAASEAAESDLNDHRKRLREIMGWDDTISDCSALPELWRALVTQMAKAVESGRLRPLILPTPADYHWQIGHAIELTFPTHADAEKLRVELAGARALDRDDPKSVLRWLGPLIARHRFSRSFNDAFGTFSEAWSSGERALRDDRFWTGWRLVSARVAAREAPCPFELECDEWGGYRLVDTTSDEVFHLAARGVERRLPPSLAAAVRDARPIPLLERDWARWAWTGPGAQGRNLATGALFYVKSISPSRLTDLKPLDIVGSPGWAFSQAVDLILPGDVRARNGTGEMLDLDISGPPRVDGGYLGRSSFPIHLRTRGPVAKVILDGEGADRVDLQRLTATEWIARPIEPLDADLRARAIPTMGSGDFPRRLRLRRASLAPEFKATIPDRYAPDEPATPAGWSVLEEVADASVLPGTRDMASAMDPRLADLIEYLAARSGILPLSGMLDLLAEVVPAGSVDIWRILRSLFEAGTLEPLRVRGWRGKAVVARPPSGALMRIGARFGLRFEGVVSEVTQTRIMGAARSAGLEAIIEAGASIWSVNTLLITASDRTRLFALATDLDLPARSLAPDLFGLTPVARFTPTGPIATNYKRTRVEGPLELWRCDPERDDAQIVWATRDREGDDRFWNERNLAVLDACRFADLRPFKVQGGELVSGDGGAHLPLAAARWLRLATGVASGPSDDGAYRYGHDAGVEPMLRHVLGDLIASGTRPAPRVPVSHPRSAGQGGIATWAEGGVLVQPVWRRARKRLQG